MASAAVTHIFVNGTAADAIQMNTNFDDLVDFLNDETIHADGSKAFTDNVSQPTTPTDPDHLTRKGYVDDESAKLIPKALMDAAGDLIVADAADSVVRLAKGGDGEYLQVVAGSVVWGAAGVLPTPGIAHVDGSVSIPISNKHYAVVGNPNTAPVVVNNINTKVQFVGPFYVSSPLEIDGLGIYINASSGNIRLALYEADSTGKPITLRRETADTAQIGGSMTIAITAYTLETGKLYWLALQTSLASGSLYRTSSDLLTHGGAGHDTALYSSQNKWVESQAYGAFPATATPVAEVTNTAPAGVPMLTIVPV